MDFTKDELDIILDLLDQEIRWLEETEALDSYTDPVRELYLKFQYARVQLSD